MKQICLHFHIHQPFRLKRYRFFDIGTDHYYYDDYTNELIIQRLAQKTYLPSNYLIFKLIEDSKQQLKVSFSISGLALKQFQMYAPEVIESFKLLAKTGCVEFVAQPYAHSLSSLKSKSEFITQIKMHAALIEELFGSKPQTFQNTELIYSDKIGDTVQKMGFKAIITEGAKHILGWKSAGFVYCNAINPRLKILLRSFRLSDDISFRFSNTQWNEYPLTSDKFIQWILKDQPKDEIVNLIMNYETFGELQKKESGIFTFLENFIKRALKMELKFSRPAEIVQKFAPISSLHVTDPISWADEERDISAWLGNAFQKEAFQKLYDLEEKVNLCSNTSIHDDWLLLQASDHFYYMCTKFFSDGEVHSYFSPYDSPYDAFINYMNVLSDFTNRLNNNINGANAKTETIKHYEDIIKMKEATIVSLQKELETIHKAIVEEPINKPIRKDKKE